MNKFKKVRIIDSLSDITILRSKEILVVKSESQIVFRSPFNPDNILYLSTDPNQYPSWEYYLENGKITILPSIEYYEGKTYGHFFILENIIYNVEDF